MTEDELLADVDRRAEEMLNMTDEQVTLSLARAGKSPEDMRKMFDRFWSSLGVRASILANMEGAQ